jgi:hypothetical protein
MLKRKDYLDIIEEIRNTELLALDEFIEKTLEPLRVENKYFDEILYKDIAYLLNGFGRPGDGDLVIEDGDWVSDGNDLKLTGYQTRLHQVLVWLHTNITTKLLNEGDIHAFTKKMESFETDHLGRSEYTPEYKSLLDKLKSSLDTEYHQNQPVIHMTSYAGHSTSHNLAFFTDPKNIPNQELVEETIDYFTNGPGARVFEPLAFLNLLEAQRDFVVKNRGNTSLVIEHLGGLPFNDLQKHALYGFILKWNGGYPIDNLDPDADRTLKAICTDFLAYPGETPEKNFCKANAATHKRFRYLESLFNTSWRTGVPVDVLAKQTEFQFEKPPKTFTTFNDLYLEAVDQNIIPAPKDKQSLAVQMVRKGIEFNDWLEATYQWHPADRERFGEFLTIALFQEFIRGIKGNDLPPSTKQAITVMEEQSKQVSVIKEEKPIKVFVTYAWEEDEHNERVISFTNHLRGMGYEAVVDRLLSQQESATHFKEMMYKTLSQANKVIVVLSKKYKTRADNFEGGVGTEFRYIVSDIPKNPKKYILVTFDGYRDEITPAALQDRDIVDISKTGSMDRLQGKLDDVPEYEFREVPPIKKQLKPKQIKPFLSDGSTAGAAEQQDENTVPWEAISVEKLLRNAISSNDTTALKAVLRDNPFLFIELASRKDFQQPVFRDVRICTDNTIDFVWLNDNSDGPEWVLIKIAEPSMAIMEGKYPSQSLSRAIDVAQRWRNELTNKPELGKKIFGAVTRLRVIVVGGSGAAWKDPNAVAWRANHNAQSSTEVRSSSVFERSLQMLKDTPGHFWGVKKNPVTRPPSELPDYLQAYGYLGFWIRLAANQPEPGE